MLLISSGINSQYSGVIISGSVGVFLSPMNVYMYIAPPPWVPGHCPVANLSVSFIISMVHHDDLFLLLLVSFFRKLLVQEETNHPEIITSGTFIGYFRKLLTSFRPLIVNKKCIGFAVQGVLWRAVLIDMQSFSVREELTHFLFYIHFLYYFEISPSKNDIDAFPANTPKPPIVYLPFFALRRT